MTILAKLKVTAEQRSKAHETVEEQLRARLLEHLNEQQELADADARGERLVKTRQAYVTNEAGERVSKTTERRLRKWYWGNADDTWFMELRYAGKALKLGVNKTSIEVGDKDKLATVIGLLKDAVKAGELDKALMTARKERTALMRKH